MNISEKKCIVRNLLVKQIKNTISNEINELKKEIKCNKHNIKKIVIIQKFNGNKYAYF